MEKHLFNRRTKLLFTILVVLASVTIKNPLMAQQQGRSVLIYGTIETINNTYKGYIRWGKEEVFWFDFFNARKEKNNYYKQNITKKEDKKTTWLDIDWNISSIWEDKRPGALREFACQFGDIRQLRVTGSNEAVVQLKNGVEIPLDGQGFNDMGTSVVIMDEEIGKVIVRWSMIDKITFSDGTNSIGDTHGNYIYGTVATYRKGTFSGFIQWDMDERLTSDVLDGDNSDGDVSIAFGKIKTIAKYRNGSKVRLNSGREFYLTNSNDVNNENRGILMIIDGVGEVKIPWSSFESVEFKKPEKNMFTYKTFGVPKGIEGTVYLHDNKSHTGKIIYDIDKVWEMETLEGDDDNVQYRIPFRHIKNIQPKNYAYSMITLRNDNKLLLGEGRDVSDKNNGLLVLKSDSKEPDFIGWDQISEIVFK